MAPAGVGPAGACLPVRLAVGADHEGAVRRKVLEVGEAAGGLRIERLAGGLGWAARPAGPRPSRSTPQTSVAIRPSHAGISGDRGYHPGHVRRPQRSSWRPLVAALVPPPRHRRRPRRLRPCPAAPQSSSERVRDNPTSQYVLIKTVVGQVDRRRRCAGAAGRARGLQSAEILLDRRPTCSATGRSMRASPARWSRGRWKPIPGRVISVRAGYPDGAGRRGDRPLRGRADCRRLHRCGARRAPSTRLAGEPRRKFAAPRTGAARIFKRQPLRPGAPLDGAQPQDGPRRWPRAIHALRAAPDLPAPSSSTPTTRCAATTG